MANHKFLEVFENTLPTILYWVLFSIEDLRQAVETTKRILTKEKIDRQLMQVNHSQLNLYEYEKMVMLSKRVTFNTPDSLEEKIDRLTKMMSKLTTQDNGQNEQFKPKVFQSKRRGQMRNFYGKCIIMTKETIRIRYGSDSRDRRISLSSRIQCECNIT